jgi:ABC-type sugar transport system ATPase subunit
LRATMKTELRKLQRKLGATFLHVTGNEEEALGMADRMILLEHGEVVQFAKPDEVYAHPKTVGVAYALNHFNLVRGRVEDGAFVGSGFSFPLPPHVAPEPGPATYCIGYDRIAVAEVGADVPAGHCSIVTKHITHEFSGAMVSYLFQLPDGQHFESQYHVHHRRAVNLNESGDYMLSWPTEKAFVYSAVLDDRAGGRASANGK